MGLRNVQTARLSPELCKLQGRFRVKGLRFQALNPYTLGTAPPQ